MADTGALLIVQENSEVVRQGLQNLADDIPQVGRLGIYQTAQRIVTRLHQPGMPIWYPVHWDSERQRKAFFASRGFGRGIPTRRSGEVERGWHLIRLDNGYQIDNDEPGAPFVFGNIFGRIQSLIHRMRWPLFADVVEEEIEALPEDVAEELRTAVKAEGFAVGT